MPSHNPFGFLIEDRNFPLAHAQRTTFMDKMRAVWTVMLGQPVRLDVNDANELLDNPHRLILKAADPIGLVDYLTLRIVWGPILKAVLFVVTAIALLVVGGFIGLGWFISGQLKNSRFGDTILGKGLKLFVDAVTALLIVAAVVIVIAPVAILIQINYARMAIAAVLTVACLPFTLLAHGLSKLSGRANKEAVLAHAVQDSSLSLARPRTLGAYLTKNGLSLDDICLQRHRDAGPGNDKYALKIKNRESNLQSTAILIGKLQIPGQVEDVSAARRQLLAGCRSTKEPLVACEITADQAYRSKLTRLQVPIIDEPESDVNFGRDDDVLPALGQAARIM